MIRPYLLILMLLPIGAIALEPADPMRPPPYALTKMRLERLASMPPQPKPEEPSIRPEEEFSLSSVLMSSGRRHAIINNQLVREGQWVEGARLVSLDRDSVRLRRKGQEFTLSLPSKIQLRPNTPVEEGKRD